MAATGALSSPQSKDEEGAIERQRCELECLQEIFGVDAIVVTESLPLSFCYKLVPVRSAATAEQAMASAPLPCWHLNCSLARHHTRLQSGAECLMRGYLPLLYPAVAPVLSVHCGSLSDAELTAISEALLREVASPEDQECLYDALLLFQSLAAAAVAARRSPPPSAAALPPRAPPVVISPPLRQDVLVIDHLNERSYETKLSRWCSQLGLRGEMLWRQPRRSKRKAKQKRRWAEHAVVVLEGHGADVAQFQLRLRTESVDRDARGVRCKERKSRAVLSRALALGDERLWAKARGTWSSVEYASEEELRRHLEGRGLGAACDAACGAACRGAAAREAESAGRGGGEGEAPARAAASAWAWVTDVRGGAHLSFSIRPSCDETALTNEAE